MRIYVYLGSKDLQKINFEGLFCVFLNTREKSCLEHSLGIFYHINEKIKMTNLTDCIDCLWIKLDVVVRESGKKTMFLDVTKAIATLQFLAHPGCKNPDKSGQNYQLIQLFVNITHLCYIPMVRS